MKSYLKKILIWIGIAFGVLLAAVLVLLIVLSTLKIPIDLDPIRERIESRITDELKRKVYVNGKLELVPSLWPTLAADNVVRLLPPLIIKESHVDEAIAILERVAKGWDETS